MLALSTAWFPRGDDRLAATLRAIRGMGFEAVEIGVSGARFRLKKVQKLTKELGLRVVSVHNVCTQRQPDPENRRGDWLASTDPEKRQKAVQATLETIGNAAALGAEAVVLHAGSLPIEEKWEKQEILYRVAGGKAPEVSREGFLAERSRLAPSHLDAVSQSLAELLERSEGVKLAIECRMGWHELPSLEELASLLDRFPDPRVGYWHDVGHAAIQDFLGLADEREWLRRFRDRTVGIHLHDVTEGVRDHYPPGLGDVDFGAIHGLLRPGALLVMEIASRFIAEEIMMGRTRLQEIGLCS